MSRVKLAVFAVIFGLLALAAPAGAQDNVITIAVEGVLTGSEDEVVPVVSETVDPSLVGATCEVEGQTENNSSVHPGNDLILTTGDSTATIENTEEFPGEIAPGSGTIVLGETIDISVRFGPDGVTSGGVIVTFDCAPSGPVETGLGGTAGGDDNGLMLVALGAVAIAAAGAFVGWKRFAPNA